MHQFQYFFYTVLRYRELDIHVLISVLNKFILPLVVTPNRNYMNKYAANAENVHATTTHLKEKIWKCIA